MWRAPHAHGANILSSSLLMLHALIALGFACTFYTLTCALAFAAPFRAPFNGAGTLVVTTSPTSATISSWQLPTRCHGTSSATGPRGGDVQDLGGLGGLIGGVTLFLQTPSLAFLG